MHGVAGPVDAALGEHAAEAPRLVALPVGGQVERVRLEPARPGGERHAENRPTVGDDVAVLARFEHVLDARRRGVGDGRGLRHADAEHAARGAGVARADAHEHADGAGAHEVQRGGVAGHAAHDHRHLALADELPEVERLDPGAHVLGRDHGALDDEHVEACFERDLVVVLHALRRERRGGEHAAVLDLLDAPGDQLGLDGLLVDLLHRARGRVVGQRGDAVELLVGVLVAGLDALEVEHGETAELAHGDGEAGVDHAVHGGGEARELERVLAELPGDVHVLGVAGPPAGHDGDVVEAVGPAALLAAADLYFHAVLLTGKRCVIDRRSRVDWRRDAGSPTINKRPRHGRTGVSELWAMSLAVCGGNVARLYQRTRRESTHGRACREGVRPPAPTRRHAASPSRSEIASSGGASSPSRSRSVTPAISS